MKGNSLCRWSRPLLAALLAATLAATGVPSAASEPRAATALVGWAPSRDEAVVVDALPASHVPEMMPGERVMTGSRQLRRPTGLSRPAPPELYGIQSGRPIGGTIVGGELLPAVTPAPAGPLSGGMIIDGGSLAGESIIGPGAIPGMPGACGEACLQCPGDCCGNWQSCGPIHPLCLLPPPRLEGFELFAGAQGFTGPPNRGGSGSFGFHEGFNWGMPVCGLVAWQWGINATQSTFDGNYLTSDDRNQLFLTGGFFRRVDWGLQWGLVVDYFHDEWDYEADLVQLRGELSWLWDCKHELGFWFTSGVHEANNIPLRTAASDMEGLTFDTTTVTFETNDLFAFFYRRQFACGGEGRLFGGFTSHSQGLVGADVHVPINPCWSVRSGFLYVVPDKNDAENVPGFVEESWNVGVSLVWTPWARPAGGPRNYVRPLLTVADNGSFVSRISGN